MRKTTGITYEKNAALRLYGSGLNRIIIKMKIMLLLIFVIGFNLSAGQEKERNKPSMVFADTVINNGWIILHGRLLDRPFHFHLENDTFRINDIQYLPSPPDPLQKPPEWVPEHTELGKWYFETSEIFFDSCYAKQKRWLRKFGAVTARDSLQQYIETQKLIEIKSFNIASDGSFAQIVFDYRHLDLMQNPTPRLKEEFSKPGSEYISIGAMLWSEIDEDTTRVVSTQGEIFHNEYNRIKDLLVNGMFLYLNYGGFGEYGCVRGRETEFSNAIRDILKKSISEAQMVMELNEKLGLDSLWAEYIVFNRNYWVDSLTEEK